MSIFDVLKKIGSPLNQAPKTTPPFVGDWNRQPTAQTDWKSKLPPIEIQANNAPIQTEMATRPVLPEIDAPQPVKPSPFAKLGELINQPIQPSAVQNSINPTLPEIPLDGIEGSFDRPRIVDNQPVNDVTRAVAINPRESQQTLDRIAAIRNKNYGFERDENGEILRDENGKKVYAAGRDKTHNVWDVLRSIGIGALQGAGSGNGLGSIIGGAAAGGVAGTLDRNFDEKWNDQRKLGQLQNQYEQQAANEANEQAYQQREVNRQNVIDDNNRQAQTARDQAAVRRDELNRKIEKDAQDAEEKRLTRESKNIDRLANLYNRLQSFDPADPNNAGLVKQMQAAGLPVVKKDATKNIRFERDYRTGEIYQIVTDTKTGISEPPKALVKADGSPLAPTPQIVVQGEYANQRNNANIQSRKEIADSNNQARIEAAKSKIGNIQKSGVKPDALLKAIQTYAQKNFKSLQQAKDDFKAAGFNTDILGN